ncbi:histidine phosphatase family protein [Streptomyces sp. NBC_00859]|uniref:histidine phosphatase family protein n=1 Tax=Streptomyces sp. NBC_00859 TaxID=2903682 RepID=UPI00386EA515
MGRGPLLGGSRLRAGNQAARLGLGVRIDEELREADFGAWEGLAYAEVQQRCPDAPWLRSPAAAPPGGESPDDVADRVGPARDELPGTVRGEDRAGRLARGAGEAADPASARRAGRSRCSASRSHGFGAGCPVLREGKRVCALAQRDVAHAVSPQPRAGPGSKERWPVLAARYGPRPGRAGRPSRKWRSLPQGPCTSTGRTTAPSPPCPASRSPALRIRRVRRLLPLIGIYERGRPTSQLLHGFGDCPRRSPADVLALFR